MSDLIGMCGCDCGSCPSYKGNLKTDDDRQACSLGWKKYLNINLSPDKLRPCDGCSIDDAEREVSYLNCAVRQCAIFNGINNCAYCAAYPCQDLLAVHSLQQPDALAKIEQNIGRPIPAEDYLAFIEPYEGIRHLDRIRLLLDYTQIVEITAVSAMPQLAEFPGELTADDRNGGMFKRIYVLLSSLAAAESVSYARMLALKQNRKQLLKLLWAFADAGVLGGNGAPHLTLASEAYNAHKLISYRARLERLCNTLAQHGVECQLITLDADRWLTPSGALRAKGWKIRLTFGEAAGGDAALKALISYAGKLSDSYGRQAYRRFSRADMSVMVQLRA